MSQHIDPTPKQTDLDALKSKSITRIRTTNIVSKSGGTATISFPDGITRDNIVIVNAFLAVSGIYYFYPSAIVDTVSANGISVRNNGGADGYLYVDFLVLS